MFSLTSRSAKRDVVRDSLYKSGDLNLDLYPLFSQKCHGHWTRIHQLLKSQEDRTSIVACTSRKDRQRNVDSQTDRQTYIQTAVTNILSDNRRFRPGDFANTSIAVTSICEINNNETIARAPTASVPGQGMDYCLMGPSRGFT